MGHFAPMGETINNPQGILGVLKVPGTPKSGNDDILAFLGKMSGKHDISTLERKNAKIFVFCAFGGAGDLQKPLNSLGSIRPGHHGGP